MIYDKVSGKLKEQVDVNPRRAGRRPTERIRFGKAVFEKIPRSGQMPPNIRIRQREKGEKRNSQSEKDFEYERFHFDFSDRPNFFIAKIRFLSIPGYAGKNSPATLYQPRALAASDSKKEFPKLNATIPKNCFL